jgi:hypothetical protein
MAKTVNDWYAEKNIVRKIIPAIVKNKLSICGDKIPYHTKEDADEVVSDIIRKDKLPHNAKSINSYRCPVCRFFHVGTRKYKKRN